MFNLADILAQVQKNPGLEGMAKVYGLSAEQTKATMDALLPAFSMGMNRAVQSPLDVAGLFGTFAKAPDFAKMMENPMAAGPAMMQAGQEVMAKVFGSNDLTQAIAQQAASMSGVGQEATKQMMPVMASLLMSGLMKQAMGRQEPARAIAGGRHVAVHRGPEPAAGRPARRHDGHVLQLHGRYSPAPPSRPPAYPASSRWRNSPRPCRRPTPCSTVT